MDDSTSPVKDSTNLTSGGGGKDASAETFGDLITAAQETPLAEELAPPSEGLASIDALPDSSVVPTVANKADKGLAESADKSTPGENGSGGDLATGSVEMSEEETPAESTLLPFIAPSEMNLLDQENFPLPRMENEGEGIPAPQENQLSSMEMDDQVSALVRQATPSDGSALPFSDLEGF
jgi:hypothetical protein